MLVRDIIQYCDYFTLVMIGHEDSIDVSLDDLRSSPYRAELLNSRIKNIYADYGVCIQVAFDKDIFKYYIKKG